MKEAPLTIMNSNYVIREFDMYSQDIKEFNKDLKSMKEIICKRKCKESGKDINLSSDFIMNKINELRKNNDIFAFAIYQSVLIYDKQSKKPTAILFAKKASKNDAYILLLLCKYEGTQKGLGTLLLNKLVEKAIKNNIKEIFVESTQDAKKFYKQYNFDTESDKEQFTESDKQEECFGYLYKVPNNKELTGGGNNKYYFNFSTNELKLFDNEMKLLEKIKVDKLIDPTYGYIAFDIDDYNENNPLTSTILNILDYISENNMILKIRVLVNPNNKIAIKMFEDCGYIHKNKKTGKDIYYLEKLHVEPHIIDRTVLSYNFI